MTVRYEHPKELPIPQEWLQRGSVHKDDLLKWLAVVAPTVNMYSTKLTGKRGAKGGRVPELGNVYMRSTWEKNYGFYLNFLKAQGIVTAWEYEPHTFYFNEWYRKGAIHYTPDFLVTYADGKVEYVEVKGYMDSVSKTKLKRYDKHYGEMPVRLVTGPEYRVIERQVKHLIPTWE